MQPLLVFFTVRRDTEAREWTELNGWTYAYSLGHANNHGISTCETVKRCPFNLSSVLTARLSHPETASSVLLLLLLRWAPPFSLYFPTDNLPLTTALVSSRRLRKDLD